MADVRIDLNRPVELPANEDEETLAAIDRGIRDADAGRLTPLDEVEKLLPEWISKFSSPTKPRSSNPSPATIQTLRVEWRSPLSTT